MKLDHQIKVSDLIQLASIVIVAAMIWGSTSNKIETLNKRVDEEHATAQKLSEGFATLAQSQAVLTAIVEERERHPHSLIQSPKAAGNN